MKKRSTVIQGLATPLPFGSDAIATAKLISEIFPREMLLQALVICQWHSVVLMAAVKYREFADAAEAEKAEPVGGVH